MWSASDQYRREGNAIGMLCLWSPFQDMANGCLTKMISCGIKLKLMVGWYSFYIFINWRHCFCYEIAYMCLWIYHGVVEKVSFEWMNEWINQSINVLWCPCVSLTQWICEEFEKMGYSDPLLEQYINEIMGTKQNIHYPTLSLISTQPLINTPQCSRYEIGKKKPKRRYFVF